MVALEMADHVLLVTQLDLPCLRNVVRLMMSFERDGRARRTRSRSSSTASGCDNGQISLKKAQETIGREIFWQLPNDYRAMVEVRNNGVPLIEQAPKAAITQSIVAAGRRALRQRRRRSRRGGDAARAVELAQPLARPKPKPPASSRLGPTRQLDFGRSRVAASLPSLRPAHPSLAPRSLRICATIATTPRTASYVSAGHIP